MSPMAKMPGSLVSKAAVSTAIRSFSSRPPARDRAELHLQPIEGEHRVALDPAHAVAALDLHRREPVALALQAGDLADDQLHPPLRDEMAHLLDRIGCGPEFVAPMDQRHRAGDRLQVQHPVQRRIAASGDRDPAGRRKMLLCARRSSDEPLEPVGAGQGSQRGFRPTRTAAITTTGASMAVPRNQCINRRHQSGSQGAAPRPAA